MLVQIYLNCKHKKSGFSINCTKKKKNHLLLKVEINLVFNFKTLFYISHIFLKEKVCWSRDSNVLEVMLLKHI